ncbi:MAG: 3-hydroxybutyryl-CoA dehydrogenase [bacterium]
MAEIKRAGVVGAGTMGNGIAQVFAMAGCDVVMTDVEQRFVDRGVAAIGKSLGRLVAKEKLTQAQADEVTGRVTAGTGLELHKDCDIVVEAIVEDFAVKQRVFAELDRVCRPGALLASNTSTISVTGIAAATKRPELVAGMHFMNPVPVMKLVEVVRGLQSSEETIATVVALSARLGKAPVVVNDSPGFVSNRVLLPMINEAVFALDEGVAGAEEIDTVMKLGMNHPIGPLALADLIGLDVCLAILEVLHRDLGDPKYRPCPRLRRMVAAGWLGRKTGRGFYEYAK